MNKADEITHKGGAVMSSYQMSIEDIAYAEKIAELPGRTAFIDDVLVVRELPSVSG